MWPDPALRRTRSPHHRTGSSRHPAKNAPAPFWHLLSGLSKIASMGRSFPRLLLALAVVFSCVALADKPAKEKSVPPGQAKKAEPPPGLAKKGGLPPGLAKRFGTKVPERAYIAFDPRYQDRAWFLIEDRWVLKSRFESSVRLEVQAALTLPAVPPPLPLPPSSVTLRVVAFP